LSLALLHVILCFGSRYWWRQNSTPMYCEKCIFFWWCPLYCKLLVCSTIAHN